MLTNRNDIGKDILILTSSDAIILNGNLLFCSDLLIHLKVF